jgi:SAM-dependent methyltransferase
MWAAIVVLMVLGIVL